MPAPEPIYTSVNCKFAFQLRWGVTIFWHSAVDELIWLEQLASQLACEGIRVLSWRWKRTNVSQFALSTLPHVSPARIVDLVQRNLQLITQDVSTRSLRPNFSIRSYGTQDRKVVEAYVAKQPLHHPVASPATQQFFESIVIENEDVDLSIAKRARFGVYWFNLHIVLVHLERWRCGNRDLVLATRDIVTKSCGKKNWQLSRLSLVPDHLHMAIGCSFQETPSEIVLSLMNNIAWVHGMKPLLCHSAFVGTFGEYDQRSVAGRSTP